MTPGPKPNQKRRPDLTPEQLKLFNQHYEKAERIGRNIFIGPRTRRSIDYAKVSIDDSTQGALLGLWEAVLGWKEEMGNKFWTYAYRIVLGRALDELRRMYPRQKGHRKMLNSTFSFEQVRKSVMRMAHGMDDDRKLSDAELVKDSRECPVGADLENRDEVIAVLGKGLSNQQRSILVMYYIDGVKMHTIGERLGISESRVSQVMSLTMEFLAEKYGQPVVPAQKRKAKSRNRGKEQDGGDDCKPRRRPRRDRTDDEGSEPPKSAQDGAQCGGVVGRRVEEGASAQ